MTFKVDLIVKPRAGIRDPQGDAVQEALHSTGFRTARITGVGRHLAFELDADSKEAAEALIDDMCRRLLVNPNLETHEFTLSQLS